MNISTARPPVPSGDQRWKLVAAAMRRHGHSSDALIETKDAVDRVRSDLPTDLLQPTVSAVNVAGDATQVYAIASTRMDEEALSWFVDDTVAKTVLGVSGVGRFERVGGVQREVRIEVDPVRLTAQGVTAADVSHALRQVQQDSSGGRGQLGLQRGNA